MYKHKLFLILFFVALQNFAFCQNENNIWYFGSNAGLNFNTTIPTTLLNGALLHTEGVSSICDSNGDLLFYTNGIKVWNANHLQMPNGIGLGGNNSSSQIVIVPKPGDCNIYYIFTTPSQTFAGACYYTTVDMRLDNGFGDIVTKNTFLYETVSERITATLQNNNTDYWVVLQELGNNNFLTFSVTNLGVNSIPIISSSGLINATVDDAVGSMKISKNGSKLCTANELGFGKCQLFDFSNLTGIVSNGFIISDTAAYGVEFSDDDSKLYLCRYGKFRLTQYDLSSNNPTTIKNSELLLANNFTENGGSLQKAPNNKIYVARASKTFLDEINNPNVLGVSCGYINNSINLNGKICQAGLPNHLKQYTGIFCGSLKATFFRTTACANNDATITAVATFGTAPYSFSIDGLAFQTSNIFLNQNNGVHEITAKDVFGVLRKVQIDIPVTNALSLSTLNIIDPNCGFADGTVTLKATNGIRPLQYSKDGINFQADSTFLNVPASTLNFVVKDINGCTATKKIILKNKNLLKVFAGRDTGIFINQTINLFAKDLTTSNFITYNWQPSYGLDNSNLQNPIATIDKDIDYEITATNAAGCTAIDTVHIDVYKEIGIFVPTAFTPNNDNKNDILKAIPRGIKQLNYFVIYNRYGQQIFYTNNFSVGWDGKIQGVIQNTNSYIWKAKGIDINGNIVNGKGMFTLLR
ncbi:MAG: T9SS type B sorting domain-containing protein [Ferruginibacter sp.]|nr:T9SS type B sorting domain-containing protein [Ferruginibacter sp.]